MPRSQVSLPGGYAHPAVRSPHYPALPQQVPTSPITHNLNTLNALHSSCAFDLPVSAEVVEHRWAGGTIPILQMWKPRFM